MNSQSQVNAFLNSIGTVTDDEEYNRAMDNYVLKLIDRMEMDRMLKEMDIDD